MENIQISKIIQSKRGIRLPDKMQPRQQRVLNTRYPTYRCHMQCAIRDLRNKREKKKIKTETTEWFVQ